MDAYVAVDNRAQYHRHRYACHRLYLQLSGESPGGVVQRLEFRQPVHAVHYQPRRRRFSWLSISPTQGACFGFSSRDPTECYISYLISQLPPGFYSATIVIKSPTACNSPLTIPVSLTIKATAPIIARSSTNLFMTMNENQSPSSQSFSVWNLGSARSITR